MLRLLEQTKQVILKEDFLPGQLVSREEALKGMTIWAAIASFEEEQKGSLEPGKFADFVVLDRDILQCAPTEILSTNVLENMDKWKFEI